MFGEPSMARTAPRGPTAWAAGPATAGDVQHPRARPRVAPGDQVAAEGREERDVLVVLAGQFVEEPQHGRRIRHGSHPVTRATGAPPDLPPMAHAPFPGSCQRPLVPGVM